MLKAKQHNFVSERKLTRFPKKTRARKYLFIIIIAVRHLPSPEIWGSKLRRALEVVFTALAELHAVRGFRTHGEMTVVPLTLPLSILAVLAPNWICAPALASTLLSPVPEF